MKKHIDYIFPHPIAQFQLDVDNDAITKVIYDILGDVRETKQHGWNCEVISSYNHKKYTAEFYKHNCVIDLLKQTQQAGAEFVKEVGWEPSGNHFPYTVDHAWFNLYRNDGDIRHWQEAHHHGVHDICAIYYATVDDSFTEFDNPNSYTFHLAHGQKYGSSPVTKKLYRVIPQPGKLVIFPGYMFHRVNPSKSNNFIQNRITIAMNFVQLPEEERLLSKINDSSQLNLPI
tara:strand:+ start:9691 stop:10380 length:690 start_codon:yes stop_codon:yes gene_type:complete